MSAATATNQAHLGALIDEMKPHLTLTFKLSIVFALQYTKYRLRQTQFPVGKRLGVRIGRATDITVKVYVLEQSDNHSVYFASLVKFLTSGTLRFFTEPLVNARPTKEFITLVTACDFVDYV